MKIRVTASLPMPGQCGIEPLISKEFNVVNQYADKAVQIESVEMGLVILRQNEYEVIEA
jgi:hypothetical protein